MNYSCFIVLLFTVLIGCVKPEPNIDLPVIGHAITGLYNPQRIYKDNTQEAFQYAMLFADLGGIEIDVQLSKEGTLWLYHDQDLSSQTNFYGTIKEYDDLTLSEVNYKSFHREKLTRLEDLIIPEKNHDLHLYIDLKDFNYRSIDSLLLDDLVNSLNTFMTNNPYFTNLSLILLDLSYLEYFTNHGFTSFYTDINDLNDGKQKKNIFPLLEGVFVRNANISKTDVKQLQEDQLKVIIFDMRTIFSIRKAKEKKPNEIMVEEFRTALKER
jgi:glycerophosphoryl diester phosphodiesterase